VGGTNSGFLFGFDFSHAGSEMLQEFGFFEIDALDIFLTEIAGHLIRFTIFNFSRR